jgi:PKD repeat protein
LLIPDSVPTFTLQPQSTSTLVGTNITLTATATGYPQISYKWYKDGNLLSNQTADSLALADATSATAGSYTVVATNTNASTVSASAVITIINNQPPLPDHGSGRGGGGAFSLWSLVALTAATLTRIYGQRR